MNTDHDILLRNPGDHAELMVRLVHRFLQMDPERPIGDHGKVGWNIDGEQFFVERRSTAIVVRRIAREQ